MTDIDWKSQPEATHYQEDSAQPWERLSGGVHYYLDNGKWEILGDGDIDIRHDTHPRPAKSRNWLDHAMWFDAPEWAAKVCTFGASEFYAYCDDERYQYFENGNRMYSWGCGGFHEHEATIIATRPTTAPKPETEAAEEDISKKEYFTNEEAGILIGSIHPHAIKELRKQADALIRAADYLESIQQ